MDYFEMSDLRIFAGSFLNGNEALDCHHYKYLVGPFKIKPCESVGQ